METRQSARTEITRGKLMQAAEAIFSQEGLSGARVDDIARAAGVNKRMIYAHFGSKEQLYMAVLEAVYGRLARCEADSGLEQLPVEAAIGTLVDKYFDFLAHNESYVRMVMWENLNRGRYMDRQGLSRVRDPMKRAMARLLERGKREGRLRADADEEQVLLSLFALSFNYFSNYHTLSRVMGRDLMEPEAMERRAEAVTALLLADLKEGQDAADR